MIKQNLHIHSTYCDGRDTPEEMTERAIELGFDSIGFSTHSYMYYSPKYAKEKDHRLYKAHINRLKEEYADRIEIFCGLEVDMYSRIDYGGYDYLIGSVHYFDLDGTMVGFDRSAEVVKNVIDTHFGGDGMAYAKKYYETMALLPQFADFDIIGHFDLITKHSDNVTFFDEDTDEYRSYVTKCAEALVGKIPYFEVNTGAVARGYRKTPYPSPFILDEMKRLGFGAVITSDCHDRRQLDCMYDGAVELLKEHGFDEIYILTDKGFVPSAITEV